MSCFGESSFAFTFSYPTPPAIEIPDPYTRFLPLVTRSRRTGLDISFGNRSEPSLEDVHKFKTAPLFSSKAHSFVQTEYSPTQTQVVYPQYGFLGLLDTNEAAKLSEMKGNLVFSNTEEPHSTFICGSQGSGKSHTLSCLLENSLLQLEAIGSLQTPLSAMVFHYDKFSNFSSGQVCETAYLCSVGIPVRVLVAPTSLNRMTRQYTNLPGLPANAPKPNVMPLYFSQEQLSVDIMMTLMAVHDTGASAPLYICAISQILRDIALNCQDKQGFDYRDFRHRLACLQLVPGQSAPLNMRLDLLEGVLLEEKQTKEALGAYNEIWTFEPGTLTIVDLSDQFVNEQDACALFSICLKLFMDGWQSNPRIVALDEAHKFLKESSEATKLTSDLVAIIRQQRHLSSRVIIATQEPTVSGELLDLCNTSIVHRFNSPEWFSTLRAHLAGANVKCKEKDGLFREIVQLGTGEALVFCPTAIFGIENGNPQLLRDSCAKVKIRDRLSADGGRSVLPSHQFQDGGDTTVFRIESFRRFDSSRLPPPGSLAGKGKANIPAGHPTPSTVNGITSPDSSSTRSHKRPASTELQPEKQKTPSFDSTSQVAIAASNKYPISITQAQLEGFMYEVIQKSWKNVTLPKDPVPHMPVFLKKTSFKCGRLATYLSTQFVNDNGLLVPAATVLRRVLRQYYDDRLVPTDQRADIGWLRD